MTARRAAITLSRAALRETETVSPAAIGCASADLPRVLESDGLDSTHKKCMLLFQMIERGEQDGTLRMRWDACTLANGVITQTVILADDLVPSDAA